ncbi:MAG: oxidoreductase FAD/NAD(P)-binding domain protein [Flavipsychrobacter sp.]|nr:oxidoreductase FAD/NAD(P)-binding domain protein [Flavipsychrobacter sp.]
MEHTEHIVRILNIAVVTHDVKQFRIEKPEGYSFIPGQATEVSINNDAWKNEKRPFTFTCLNEQPYLEFTIKRYADHNGVTNQLHQLQAGDELIIRDVWGAIEYKGPGYFIAGGAGITPFLAILRQLHKDGKLDRNKLLFANKTAADIICHNELSAILGENMINILSEETNDQYVHGRIDDALLQKIIGDFHTHFYVCGPDKMISDINDLLVMHGASPDRVVFEK